MGTIEIDPIIVDSFERELRANGKGPLTESVGVSVSLV